jgi:tetratricopeptide (TPR) repeat protein
MWKELNSSIHGGGGLMEGEKNNRERQDLFNRGQQLYEQGKWQEALRVYNSAIRAWPRDERFYYARGCLHFKLHEYFRAIEDLTLVIAINPGLSREKVRELRGNAYFETGDFDHAICDLSEAIETGSVGVQTYLMRGVSSMKTGRYKEAVADFEVLLRHSKYEDCALVALGDSCVELGEYERAIEYYSRLADQSPFCAWVYMRRATAYQRWGNLQAAMDDYGRLISFYNNLVENDPKQGWVYFTRGFVLEKMGRRVEAKADYARAERL